MTGPEPVRIAMWSGPRNLSTALMRAFENRPDAAVVDEPFYGAYLALTGARHPLREEVLATQRTDAPTVARSLLGPVPGGRPIFYQKHMTHHMVVGIPRDWMARCRNAFLIRAPEAVLASYAAKRDRRTLEEIGFVTQWELFEGEAARLGTAPPVIEASNIRANPRGALTALCAALAIPFDQAMLRWPPGPRPTDGAWAPAWYDTVERSTGFAPPNPEATMDDLDAASRAIAQAARPYYERLARYALRPLIASGSPAPSQTARLPSRRPGPGRPRPGRR